MYHLALSQKSIFKLSIGLKLELVPVVFFKTWKAKMEDPAAARLGARRARRRKKARPERFESAYRMSGEENSSVLTEALEYIRQVFPASS